MAHEVIFAPEALADLIAIYDHIAGEASPERAQAYVGRNPRHCLALAVFPARGTRRDDLRPGLRTIGYGRRVAIAFHPAASIVASTACPMVAATSRACCGRAATADRAPRPIPAGCLRHARAFPPQVARVSPAGRLPLRR